MRGGVIDAEWWEPKLSLKIGKADERYVYLIVIIVEGETRWQEKILVKKKRLPKKDSKNSHQFTYNSLDGSSKRC